MGTQQANKNSAYKISRDTKTELSNKIKEPMAEDIKEFLLKISKYQILASQLNGYFPLSISQTDSSNYGRLVSRLTFSFFSIPFFYTLLQCILFPLILLKLSDVNSFIVNSVTKGIVSDGVALRVLYTTYIVWPLVLRTIGLFLSKRALHLWRKNCSLLEIFFMDRFILSVIMKGQSKMKSRSKVAFYVALTLSVLGTIAFTHLGTILSVLGLARINEADEALAKNDIPTQLFILILPFFALIHPLSVALVIWFPKFYCLCLQIIAEKLKSLSLVKDLLVISGSFAKDLNNKKPNSKSYDEAVIKVIEMYENISKLVKEFNSQLETRLLGEIMYNMLCTLGFTYFIIVWVSDGQYSASLSMVIPVILSAGQMYMLGIVGSRLQQKSTEVLEALQDLNPENMSPKIQWKVKMLMSQISLNPLQITPG